MISVWKYDKLHNLLFYIQIIIYVIYSFQSIEYLYIYIYMVEYE